MHVSAFEALFFVLVKPPEEEDSHIHPIFQEQSDGQVYAQGEDVVLEWATRCSSGGRECATSTLLLLDDLSIASGIVGGRGTVKVMNYSV